MRIARLQAHKGYRAQPGLKGLLEAMELLGLKDPRVSLGMTVQTVQMELLGLKALKASKVSKVKQGPLALVLVICCHQTTCLTCPMRQLPEPT